MTERKVRVSRAAFDGLNPDDLYRPCFAPVSKQLISLEDAGRAMEPLPGCRVTGPHLYHRYPPVEPFICSMLGILI
jgi:hypothetical protein